MAYRDTVAIVFEKKGGGGVHWLYEDGKTSVANKVMFYSTRIKDVNYHKESNQTFVVLDKNACLVLEGDAMVELFKVMTGTLQSRHIYVGELDRSSYDAKQEER